jgi:Flp pilus assembly CpaE family ATPase
MLRGLVICPDSQLAELLDQALSGAKGVSIVRDFDRYPSELEFMRSVRANAPQALFLSTEVVEKALELITLVDREAAGLQVVAISRQTDPNLLLEMMRAGVREFLAPPFAPDVVNDMVGRLSAAVAARPVTLEATDQLYAFLPSKQGVGNSTVALNFAAALARQPQSSNLLIDMDLSSGIIGFLLKLNNTHSVVEAAENAHALDESLWPQLVTRACGMDVMHSGRLNPDFRMDTGQLRSLLEFARRHYKTICVDLSGNLERYSIDIMLESRKIFMVVTPEIPSLHLAREKLGFLNRLDLAGKVSVLLNRAHKRSVVTPAQIQDLLGVPVQYSLSNDYQGIHRSLQAGRPVEKETELGKQFTALAASVQKVKPQPDAEPKRRLVEYFSILPGRVPAVGAEKKAV